MMAERAAKLALLSGPRGKVDAPETGMALGTDDVAFLHGVTLCRTTMTVRRRRPAAGAKVENRINDAAAARSRVARATPLLFPREQPLFDSTTAACCVILLAAPGQGAFCIPQQF
jgi:hypothetical protein